MNLLLHNDFDQLNLLQKTCAYDAKVPNLKEILENAIIPSAKKIGRPILVNLPTYYVRFSSDHAQPTCLPKIINGRSLRQTSFLQKNTSIANLANMTFLFLDRSQSEVLVHIKVLYGLQIMIKNHFRSSQFYLSVSFPTSLQYIIIV